MTIPILVTGGAGYVGAHTCKALTIAGFAPITLDNLSTGHSSFVRWGPLVVGDIRDPQRVEDVCREHDVQAAIHFAAHALVEESTVKPAKYYDNNVRGSIALLQGLRAAGVDKIVLSSSCSVYGAPKTQPITEDTPPQPICPYGMSKLMVEHILADYGRAYDLRWLALRYFNACGADDHAEVGELRAHETHLIPRAMMWIQGHLDEFRVFGTHFPTPDGSAVRDFIHVSDLADAHVLALRRLMTEPMNRALNLGTGAGYSVKQVVQEISRVTGIDIPVLPAPARAGDAPILVADPARALTELGFSPRASDLGTIIRSAWAWHQKAHPAKARR